jgi:hypothetical protein
MPALPGPVRALLPAGSNKTAGGPRLPRQRSGGAEQLALTEVTGNLAFTASTVTAWFTLPDAVWPFRSDTRREALIMASAAQYAALAGLHLHVRRTNVPFPVDQWAHNLTTNSRPLPDDHGVLGNVTGWANQFIPGHPADPSRLEVMERVVPPALATGLLNPAPTWAQHVTAATSRLTAAGYVTGRTHLGVTFPQPSRLRRAVTHNTGLDQAVQDRVTDITEMLAAPGLAARPATSAEMMWLIYRSVGIGLTPFGDLPAGDVGPDDITEFADLVDWQRGPFASTTQLTNRSTEQSVHVAVLTVGRMENLEIPQIHEPWAALSGQLGFPIEWSSRVAILDPAASRGDIELRMNMIVSQQSDYADHGLRVPLDLRRLADRASEITDEIDTARPEEAARAHGWHRMAVAGATREECLARVREVTRVYNDARINVQHPRGQVALLREFIPGEPTANTGYLRRLPVKMLAAAVPQATTRVGDDRGDLIGVTAVGGERPVFWDPHFAPEVRERSGLTVFVAEPGGGKSTLLGALGYLNARRGVQVTLMDPSGPLARLAAMPELARYARVIDLVGSDPGTLAPYALIPTPRRTEFAADDAGDREFVSEVAMARAERSLLVLDIVQMLLPPQVIDDKDTVVALHDALRAVPREETSTLEMVVDALHEMGADGNVAAKAAASLLADRAELPYAQLFFGRPPAGVLDTDAALTVITMAGLRLPNPKKDRNQWTVHETLAVPMLHLAHRLAVRRCYSGPMSSRKFVGLDEGHFMSGWESGRAFFDRISRDSRKWNLAALVASQNPKDILELDVQNLITTAFVGRVTEDAEIAAQALRLLGAPVGVGYEHTLASLSLTSTDTNDRLGYREFVMRDVDERVQKIRVDLTHLPGLLEALDTTPGGAK